MCLNLLAFSHFYITFFQQRKMYRKVAIWLLIHLIPFPDLSLHHGINSELKGRLSRDPLTSDTLCLRINDLLLALPSCGQESDDILGKKPLKQEKSG
jgi:hypothetical protein